MKSTPTRHRPAANWNGSWQRLWRDPRKHFQVHGASRLSGIGQLEGPVGFEHEGSPSGGEEAHGGFRKIAGFFRFSSGGAFGIPADAVRPGRRRPPRPRPLASGSWIHFGLDALDSCRVKPAREPFDRAARSPMGAGATREACTPSFPCPAYQDGAVFGSSRTYGGGFYSRVFPTIVETSLSTLLRRLQ